MEPPPLTKYVTGNSKLHLFSGDSSRQDSDSSGAAPSGSQASNLQKRKLNQGDSNDIIEIDGDEDSAGIVISCEKVTTSKSKPTIGHNKNWQKQIEDALAMDLRDFDNDHELVDDAPMNPLKHFGEGSLNEDYYNESDSDLVDVDDELGIDAQIDAMDLPPGVEAPIPWFQEPKSLTPDTGSTTVSSLPCSSKQKEENEDEVEKKFILFKRFDTVSDYSDHHYTETKQSNVASSHGGSLTNKAPLEWTKKIQLEWKILEKDLPETIYVRVYEERMDLLRAVIIGPAGTPYHDGLFFFDIFFPSDYPSVPPLAYYYSGGLRLNPNLYNCGKVCLSLLNTWAGNKNERWSPEGSTMLQVLVSIQALVLNAKPYFNEPGYESTAGTPQGEKKSAAYNEEAFLLSCKTMLYTLRRPPKHFEDFVMGHFRQRAHAILSACKAYMGGTQVGCLPGEGVQNVDEGEVFCSLNFKSSLSKLFSKLVKAFTENGATNCEQFIDQLNKANTADTTLKL
eukprot:TRINITY_DN111_c0_g1_i1.p1 TRINITY_DN111_c0_g1~~TRINITY_DN111_c0_g1_i1.p1  ORF type:complete len:508 (-),score=91.21 TRINITY_DN111_c0_g1_i1:280-1803(-)